MLDCVFLFGDYINWTINGVYMYNKSISQFLIDCECVVDNCHKCKFSVRANSSENWFSFDHHLYYLNVDKV